jgi:hypothetical protein
MSLDTLRRRQWAALFLFGLLITVPYIIGALLGDSQHIFGGFLLNPIDGNSYLAKMYQGWRGDILFHLPYTADMGNGAFLFVFYLALGHLARILHLPLIVVFHSARVISAFFLVWVLFKTLVRNFPAPVFTGTLLAIFLFGLGMGWLALPFGGLTSDFWVAEAYPFLASYANPHFPLGLGLMILLLQPFEEFTWIQALKSLFLAFILALVVPFGVVIVGTVLLINTLVRFYRLRSIGDLKIQITNLVSVGLLSVPVLIYDYWVTAQDPLFAGWNAQNLTPSPPLWDLILALSPFLVLLLIGLIWFRNWYRQEHDIYLIWLAASVLLLYLPFGLQRRMMTGIYIPVVWLGCAVLATLSIGKWIKNRGTFLVLLSIPTTVLVLLAGVAGIMQQAPEIYLWRDEVEAFDWIEANTPKDALILAAPDTGLLIPAYTGRRVLYGHPFETVNADDMREQAISLLMDLGAGNSANLPQDVDYVFWGPREDILVGANPVLPLQVLYTNNTVTVYSANSSAEQLELLAHTQVPP